MTTFDEREQAFENKYAHDEELNFRARALRNLKFGLWAAHHLGKSGNEADEYAQAVVAAAIEGAGGECVFDKVQHDFRIAKVTLSDHQIRREMDQLLTESIRELRARV